MPPEMKNTCWQPWLRVMLVGAYFMQPFAGQAADNLNFKGVLVAQACTLRPGDDALVLDVRDVSTQYLYLNSRTIGRSFKIHLEGCDTSIGDSVTTTFGGNESTTLPGMLALDSASMAAGIAIGLETPAGKSLPLNVASDKQILNSGGNVIELNAYIKGEPQAIANQTITTGAFTAISTFTLNYP